MKKMNRKFKKALKKTYNIPKPIYKDEFLDSLKKRYPKVKKYRYNFFYSKNPIRILSAVLTVLFVIGVHGFYSNISYYQIPISDPTQINSDESPQLPEDEPYTAINPAITKENNHNNTKTPSHTDLSKSSEITTDLYKNSYKAPANTNKITNTQPKVTVPISKQENKITKPTAAVKPNNTGIASQIHTQPSIPPTSQAAVTTKVGSNANDELNQVVNNVVTTPSVEHNSSSDNHKPLSSTTTTYFGVEDDLKITTVSSTTIQTEPATIPVSDKSENENIVRKAYTNIYFYKEKNYMMIHESS